MELDNDLLLKMKDLHVHFMTREGVVQALNGVNLEIVNGEALGLVGESGCGKSVTAQAILRIIPRPGKILRGRILFRRKNGTVAELTQMEDHSSQIIDIRRKDISIIFQEPMTALSPVHTIGNQIIEAICLEREITRKEARERAIAMLDLVGVPNPKFRIDSYTFELSGGMRQRAMIAMALSSHPNLLIADEPTTAVDVTIQAQILELIQKLRQELRMSTLIITHNLGMVAELADRVAVMYLGRIVEKASTADIFHDPRHPYTQGLINSIPKLSNPRGEKLWAIKGMVPSPYTKIYGCVFHRRCHKFMPGICDKIVPQTIEIVSGHVVDCLLYGGVNEGRNYD